MLIYAKIIDLHLIRVYNCRTNQTLHPVVLLEGAKISTTVTMVKRRLQAVLGSQTGGGCQGRWQICWELSPSRRGTRRSDTRTGLLEPSDVEPPRT